MQTETSIVAEGTIPADDVYIRTKAARQCVARRWRPGDPVPRIEYAPAEEALWSTVTGALSALHREVACARYRRAAETVRLPADRIPQLAEVSRQLAGPNGFVLVPAEGVVPAKQFYGGFADGLLHAVQYIRPATSPFYSAEPDVIHDLVGHAVMLADPLFAQLYRSFGLAARRAGSTESLAEVCRAFWFTMETGVVREGAGLRVYGAALLSSVTEMKGLHDVELLDFDLARICRQEIDDKKCQPTLFAIDSMTRLTCELQHFLDNVA